MTAYFTADRASAHQKVAVSVALTLMASTGGPLSAATLDEDRAFSYNVASVPLIAEAVKLLMSGVCLMLHAACGSRISEGKTGPLCNGIADGHSSVSENSACLQNDEEYRGSKPHGGKTQSESRVAVVTGGVVGLAVFGNNLMEELRQITWRSALVYFPPSMLFIAVNNIRILNMRYMNPASADLLGTLRIALTAVMLRCFLQRSFTKTQWTSVALLSFSVALSQMDGARFKLIGDPRVSVKGRIWLMQFFFSRSRFYDSSKNWKIQKLRDPNIGRLKVSALTFSFHERKLKRYRAYKITGIYGRGRRDILLRFSLRVHGVGPQGKPRHVDAYPKCADLRMGGLAQRCHVPRNFI